jgi:hypothetical protein
MSTRSDALQLLHRLVVDIDAMRTDNQHEFGEFSIYDTDFDGARIQWANLSILAHQTKDFLERVNVYDNPQWVSLPDQPGDRA